MHEASRGRAGGAPATVGVGLREVPGGRPVDHRTRLFRFLPFSRLSLSRLSWKFGPLPVPLLFRHHVRNAALGAEAIEPLSLVSMFLRRR
jgi:hypothetical protein